MKLLTPLLSVILLMSMTFTSSARRSRGAGGDFFADSITGLPEIDRVELLTVVGVSLNRGEKADCSDPSIICGRFMPYRILGTRSLTGDSATSLGKLWRKLKPGNGMGCFSPAYLLGFYRKDQLLVEAEVCFHCQNVGVSGEVMGAIAGDREAYRAFSEFVRTALPYPEPKKPTPQNPEKQ
jgi:hypothetical protein